MLKYCGIALTALFTVLLLRGQKSDFAGFAALAAAMLLLGAAVKEYLPAMTFLAETAEGTAFEGHLATLTKALGITLAVQFTAEICRDAGEGGLASKLELVGKAQILLLSIPLLRELMTLAGSVMG